MTTSLLAGVSGLQAHQRLLDVTGNNLANVNTTGFKSGSVSFSSLLSQTFREASQPSESSGGTNPVQVGNGVQLAGVSRNVSQGSLQETGRNLDLAIEGNGFFVMNDGSRNVFSRAGSFAVDSDNFLVDPTTGNRVQRIGSVGESDGFQEPGSDSIKVPFNRPLPAKATDSITYNGNLSADAQDPTPSVLSSGVQFNDASTGAAATRSTALTDLQDQNGNSLSAGDAIEISGTTRDGTSISTTFTEGSDGSTVGDLLDFIDDPSRFGGSPAANSGSSASIENGEIQLADNATGFSETNINLTTPSGNSGSLEMPAHFKYLSVGGEASRNTTIEVFDSLGIGHEVEATFVKQDQPNTWDMVVASAGEGTGLNKRRISGIQFRPDGAFGGLSSGSTSELEFLFPNTGGPRNVDVELGTPGQFDGLTQFGGSSTVSPSDQDGFAAGRLQSTSVNQDGTLVGSFTNGERRDLARIKLATFQNPGGLKAIGNTNFVESANSGRAVFSGAAESGVGAVRSGQLEQSNVDQAEQFTRLIRAQNGFEANARTITTSNEILDTLTNLTR